MRSTAKLIRYGINYDAFYFYPNLSWAVLILAKLGEYVLIYPNISNFTQLWIKLFQFTLVSKINAQTLKFCPIGLIANSQALGISSHHLHPMSCIYCLWSNNELLESPSLKRPLSSYLKKHVDIYVINALNFSSCIRSANADKDFSKG